jgi:hypothetical protein
VIYEKSIPIDFEILVMVDSITTVDIIQKADEKGEGKEF